MSEIINNREHKVNQSNKRQEILKQIFIDLHNGKSVEEVKTDFDKQIGTVTVDEIAKIGHGDMDGISIEEMKNLYNKHTELFKGSIEKEERTVRPEDQPGHPVHTFKLENRALEKLLEEKLQVHLEQFKTEDTKDHIYSLLEDCNLLLDIDKHFSRKENLIFPYLERYGINGPTNHMWKIDDFIRDSIKEARNNLLNYQGEKQAVIDEVQFILLEVGNMIYREENILFPMALQNFTEDEWVKIARESDEIGLCLIDNVEEWKPERNALEGNAMSDGFIKMETGLLSLKQLDLILNHLPVDITFIDKDDVVRYFSHGKERIFARTKAVIGRSVQNCHPPRSVHVVEELLEDFKSGRKDCEDFWIKFRDKYVYIRYFAVRDESGEYMGTLEFTQNIAPIQAIEGEKRILS